MNTFKTAVTNKTTTTTNGMKAFEKTTNTNVDLFYKISASRGQDIIPTVVASMIENPDITLRIIQWSRDIREGSGERQTFRNIMNYLEINHPEYVEKIIPKILELGRADDLFCFKTEKFKNMAFSILASELKAGNGLVAKWIPRENSAKKELAKEFRRFLKWKPAYYRKTLASLTNVVETQMCDKKWDDINFSHVPSIAASRYKKAFNRNTPKFAEYVESLVKGETGVKVNAGAIFPHDIIKGISKFNKTELDHIIKQWESLPNYIGDAKILPMVDVSGSMTCSVGNNTKSNLTCLDVSVALGLYCADKNEGVFKDLFLTFSTTTKLEELKGDIVQKCQQMKNSDWATSTNIEGAFQEILRVAIQGNVSPDDMPAIMLILSDMQFDSAINSNESAMEVIENLYNQYGYNIPKIVFWNLHSHDNIPVRSHKSGAALVSGFSPSILTAILGADMSEFTPYGIMMKTIMKDRYSLL